MIRIVRSTIIDAPTDRVWAFLRDFNGHDRWHPAVGKSAIERNQSSDKVGCVRHFFLRDGSELRERLLTLSDLEQTFSYCLIDTPVPLFNYVAHVRLAPVTDGDRTFWDWRCTFTTRHGRGGGDDGAWSAKTSTKRASPPCGRIVTGALGDGGPRMTVTVKTFPRLADAAGALSQERGARFLAGGTLVMRAVNEADPTIETIVRSTDPSFVNIAVSSGRVELGAGVTMAAILAERELAFLHPVARAVGGPARARSGDRRRQFVRPSPYGDFATALLALDATVMLAGGFGQRELPLDEFLKSPRARSGRWFRASRSGGRPADTFRFVESDARPSQGHVGPVDRRAIAAGERPRSAARGSPMARWARRRCAPRRPNARSKAARSMPPASRRRSRWRTTAPRRPTMPSPAPGGGAKSFPSICAGCCSANKA